MSSKGKELEEQKERTLKQTGSDRANLISKLGISLRHEVHLVGGHTGPINAIAVTPDGRRLITGSEDKTAKLWDIKTDRRLEVFKGHTGSVNAVAVTPDGTKLITASFDCTVKFWDLETGELLVTMYNLKEGYLWTTPPTINAPAGWLWTDRFDLISVVECNKDGSDPKSPADDDPRREAYLKAFNRREMVMDRLWMTMEQIKRKEDQGPIMDPDPVTFKPPPALGPGEKDQEEETTDER